VTGADGNQALRSLAVAETSCGTVVPFPFIDEVLNAMDHRGIAVFAIPFAFFSIPLAQQPTVLSARNWQLLTHPKLAPNKMQIIDINLPDGDTTPAELMSFAELQSATPNGLIQTEQQMWSTVEGSRGRSASMKVLGFKDVKGRDEWGAMNLDDKQPVDVSNEGHVRHFLNTNLFSNHSNSLFTLANENLHGVASQSYYIKTRFSLFRCHFGQAFFPSFHSCVAGACVWYFIAEKDLPQLNAFLIFHLTHRLRLEGLTKAEKNVLLMLLYTRSLWLSPRLLMEAHIPIQRVMQTAGQVVITNGCVLRWGMAADMSCLQEATNFCPVSWCTRGLKRLVQWVAELQRYCDVIETSSNAGLVLLLLDATVCETLSHHAPAHILTPFLERVKQDLTLPTETVTAPRITRAKASNSPTSTRPPQPPLATEPTFLPFQFLNAVIRQSIAADIDKVLAGFKEKRVARLYAEWQHNCE